MTIYALLALNLTTRFGIEKEEREGGGCIVLTHALAVSETHKSGGKTASVITWSSWERDSWLEDTGGE